MNVDEQKDATAAQFPHHIVLLPTHGLRILDGHTHDIVREIPLSIAFLHKMFATFRACKDPFHIMHLLLILHHQPPLKIE